jgi:type I restriction enzyme S subunit
MKEGWEIKRLGEVCDLQNGFAFKSKDYIDFSNTMNFRMSQIRPGGGIDLENNPKYLPDEYAIKYKDYLLKEGDVVIAMTDLATETKILGVPTIVPKDNRNWLLNQRVGKLHKIDFTKVEVTYLKYILTSATVNEYYKSLGRGGLQINIGKQDILNAKIPFPPLPEQQRIVSILDKCFSAIERSRNNAEQNLKNAKELFESYLEHLFSDIFQSNETKSIKELAKVVGGYSFKSGDFKKSGKYQVIRMGNVRPGIIREKENPVFIDQMDEKALSRALLLPNDVIITQTGTKKKRDYGFTVIIEKTHYMLNQRIAAIRFSELYLPKFFLYFSWTNIFKDQYFANETGTVGQGNVGIGAITDSKVPFIQLSEQKAVIQKIDIIFSETQKMEAIYQKKIADLDELKKSVLQKAFAGELKSV